MFIWLDFVGAVLRFLPTLFVILIVVAVYCGIRWLFIRQAKHSKKGISVIQQIMLFLFALTGVIMIILVWPMEGEEKRGQIIGLIGIILSAAFALSSTTFLGNILAGVMNRSIKHLQIGDFISVGDFFGKVSDLGLFHTEIQNENRDLTTLPNMYLSTNPVRVIRNSGTIVSTSVSLGYDVGRKKIESCLFDAAQNASLTDPFVYITSLGDYSVVYQINGLLADTEKNISATSRLNAMVLDALHNAKIEIVSPTFMNQRQVGETVFIPRKESQKDFIMEAEPEAVIFDKATQAKTLEEKQERNGQLTQKINEMKIKLKQTEDAEEKAQLEARIIKWEEMLVRTNEKIKEQKAQLKEKD